MLLTFLMIILGVYFALCAIRSERHNDSTNFAINAAAGLAVAFLLAWHTFAR